MACGFTMISGFRPVALVGISTSGIIIPTVPFCPALEQNLSPMAGFLILRILILAILVPVLLSVIKALSIIPVSPFFGLTEASFFGSSKTDLLPCSLHDYATRPQTL